MSFPTQHLARLRPSPADSPVHALAFSSGSGQHLLTGSQDRLIRLFNPSQPSKQAIQTYAAHGYEVLTLAISADNARFISGGGDKSVFLWDVATAQTIRRFNGHAGRVEGVAWGGEGDSVVVSGSYDGTVKIWDTRAQGGRAIQSLSEARDAVSCVSVSGGEVYAGSVDGKVRVYEIGTRRIETDVLGASVTSVVPTQAGDSYLVSTLDSTVRLMDRGSGRCLQTFKEGTFCNDTYRVRSTLAMADAMVISGSENGRVYVWDVLTGKLMYTPRHSREDGEGKVSGKGDVVAAVAWNQARKQWASAGGDGGVVIWGEGH